MSSNYYKSLVGDLIQDRVARTQHLKQEKAAEDTLNKQLGLDPNVRRFDKNFHKFVDADTFIDVRTGESHRVSGGEGFSSDSYETGLDPYGNPNNYYERNPDRFEAHRKSYAQQFGKDLEDVSAEDLYDVGRAQKQRAIERAEAGELDGVRFYVDGKDHSGQRSVAQFDPEVFDDITGSYANANYSSQYNWRALARDREGGGLEPPPVRSTARAIFGDAPVSMAKTVGAMVFEPMIMAAATLGADDFAKYLQRAKTEGWDAAANALTSDAKLYQEEMEQKRQHYIQDPLYRERVARYQEQGDHEVIAETKAWLAGSRDTLNNLVEDPGRAADVAIESLPYMVGAGITSKLATKGLQKQFRNALKDGADVQALTKLEKAIGRRASWSAVGYTGISEGVSNGVGAWDRVMNMSEEELSNSEEYQRLRRRGLTHEQAKEQIATSVGVKTMVATGLVAAVANKFTGASKVEGGLFQRINNLTGEAVPPAGFLRGSARAVGSVLSPGVREGVEETIQSGGGEAIGGAFVADATGTPFNPAESAAAAATGLVAGSLSGGVMGNLSNISKALEAGVEGGKRLGSKLGKGNVTAQEMDRVDPKRAEKTATSAKAQTEQGQNLGGEVPSGNTNTVVGREQKALNEAIKGFINEEFNYETLNHAFNAWADTIPPQGERTKEEQEQYDEADAVVTASRAEYGRVLSAVALETVLDAKNPENPLTEEEAHKRLATINQKLATVGISLKDVLETGEDTSDFLDEGMAEALEESAITAVSLESLADSLNKAILEGVGNQESLQRTAHETMFGDGKGRRGVLDYIREIKKASEEGNFYETRQLSYDLKKFIKDKASRLAIFKQIQELIEGGMSPEEAIAKAAGPNATRKYHWHPRGTPRLMAQIEKEVGIMAAIGNELHRLIRHDAALRGGEVIPYFKKDMYETDLKVSGRKVATLDALQRFVRDSRIEEEGRRPTAANRGQSKPQQAPKQETKQAPKKVEMPEVKLYTGKQKNRPTGQALINNTVGTLASGYRRLLRAQGSTAANEWLHQAVKTLRGKKDGKWTIENPKLRKKIIEVLTKRTQAIAAEERQKAPKQETKQEAPKKEAKAKQAEKTPLEAEMDDVATLLDLLGIPMPKQAKTEPTTTNVGLTLIEIRKVLRDRAKGNTSPEDTKAQLAAIIETLTWVGSEGRDIKNEARRARATKRIDDGRVKEDGAFDHLLAQLGEEALEVTIELKGGEASLAEEILKAEFKVYRFGADTKIKDGDNKGKTNQQVLDELLTQALAEQQAAKQPVQEEKELPKIKEPVVSPERRAEVLATLPEELVKQFEDAGITLLVMSKDAGPLALANAGKGYVAIREDISVESYLQYLLTNTNSAAQKRRHFQHLAEEGYPQELVEAALDTDAKVMEFILRHEMSHIRNKDSHKQKGTAFERSQTKNPLMIRAAMEIEVRATRDALEEMGIKPLTSSPVLRVRQRIDEKFPAFTNHVLVVATDEDVKFNDDDQAIIIKGQRVGKYNHQEYLLGNPAITIFADKIDGVSNDEIQVLHLLNWALHHEMNHFIFKAMFGDQKIDPKDATSIRNYQKALDEIFADQELFQQLWQVPLFANGHLGKKWANLKTKPTSWKEFQEKYPAQARLIVSEGLAELIGSLAAHDGNIEAALEALDAKYETTVFTDHYGEQEERGEGGIPWIKKMTKLAAKLAELFTVPARRLGYKTGTSLDNLVLSMYGFQKAYLAGVIDPGTELKPGLFPVEGRQKQPGPSGAANGVNPFMPPPGSKQDQFVQQQLKDRKKQEDDVKVVEEATPASKEEKKAATSEKPVVTQEALGGMPLEMFEKLSEEQQRQMLEAHERTNKRKRVPATEPGPTAEDAVQEAAAADREEEKAAPAPKKFTEDRLWLIKEAKEQLEGILGVIEANGEISPNSVTFTHVTTQKYFEKALDQAADAGVPLDLKAWVEARLKTIEAALAKRGQENDLPTGTRPDPEYSSREVKNSVEVVKEAENGEVVAATKLLLERGIRFSSRAVAITLAKAVTRTKGERKGQRWKPADLKDADESTWGEFLLDLEIAFRSRGLPTQISKGVQILKEKTSNILHSAYPVLTKMRNVTNRWEWLRSIGADAQEQQGMFHVISFMHEFEDKFRELAMGTLNELEHTSKQKSNPFSPFKAEHHKVDANGDAVFNPIQRYMMQFLMDEFGIMPDQFIQTMAIEAGNIINDRLQDTLSNDDQQMNSILGFDTQRPTGFPPEVRFALMQGTLQRNIAASLGKAILRSMNIKMGQKENNPVNQEKMEMSLGLMAITVLKEMKLVQSNEIPNIELLKTKILIHENGESESDETLSTAYKEALEKQRELPPSITITVMSKAGTGQRYLPTKKEWMELDKNAFRVHPKAKRLIRAFRGSRKLRDRLFGKRPHVREPVFEPEKAPTTRDRTQTRIPEVQRKAMEKMNQEEWVPLRDGAAVLNIIPIKDNGLKLLGGYNDHEINSTVSVKKTDREAKNAGILRNVENARDWVQQYGKKPFYLTWKMISSGRLYIVSNVINTQADKIHRFLFGMPSWTQTIPLNVPASENNELKYFKMSLALALDMKMPHPNGGEAGLDYTAARLDDMVAYVDQFFEDEDVKMAVNWVIDAVENEKQLTQEQMQWIAEQGWAAEGFHAIVGLYTWGKYQRALAAGSSSVEIQLPLEIDGKTNGISIGAIQTPDPDLEDVYYNVLAATGVFAGPYADVKNYAEFRENPDNRDNYEGTSDDAAVALNDRAENGWKIGTKEMETPDTDPQLQKKMKVRAKIARFARDELGLLKLGRKLAKSPLMVSSYQAGIKAVKRALGRTAIEEYYDSLSKIAAMEDEDAMVKALADLMMRMNKATFAGQASDKIPNWHGFYGDLDGPQFKNQYSSEEELRSWMYNMFETVPADMTRSMAIREWITTSDIFVIEKKAPKKEDEINPYFDMRGKAKALMALVAATYGYGIEQGIENRIGPVRGIRGQINSMVAMMTVISATLFDKISAANQEGQKRELSREEKMRILNLLRKEGLIASVPSVESTALNENIEILLLEEKSLEDNDGDQTRGSAYFSPAYGGVAVVEDQIQEDGSVKDQSNKKQSSSSHGVFTITMDTNIGVRAIPLSIHSSDGANVTRTIAKHTDMLPVHDAFVGHPVKMLEAMIEASRDFIDVQAGWDLMAETYGRLRPFIEVLNDRSRFTPKERFDLMRTIAREVNGEYLAVLLENGRSEEEAVQMAFSNWLAKIEQATKQNSANRIEVFNGLGYSNQFAMDGVEARISEGEDINDTLEKMTKPEEVVPISANEEGNRLSEEVREARYSMIEQIKEGGNALQVLENYLRGPNGEGVRLVDAMLLIQEVASYASSILDEDQVIADDQLQKLVTLLRAHSTKKVKNEDGKRESIPLRIRMVDSAAESQLGYKASSHTLVIKHGMGAEQLMTAIAQGGIEASLMNRLEEMKEDQAGEHLALDRVMNQALKWADAAANRENPVAMGIRDGAKRYAAAADDKVKQRNIRRQVVLAYLKHHSGRIVNMGVEGQVLPLFEMDTQGAISQMGQALRGNVFGRVYHSSPIGLNRESFLQEKGEQLTVESLTELVETWLEQENLSEFEKQLFTDLLPLLQKGLLTVDDILLKMVDNNPSGLTEGAFIDHEDTILLHTAESLGTGPRMSKTEVLMHEVLHAMTVAAIENDTAIRARVRNLLLIVDEAVDDNRISWKDLLPVGAMLEDGSVDPELEAAARARWDQIFKYRQDPSNENQVRAYAELVSYGLTNPAFVQALQNVTETKQDDPIWKGNLFSTVVGILEDIVAWFRGVRYKEGGDVHRALEQLAKDILAVNRRNQKIQHVDVQGNKLGRVVNAFDRKLIQLASKLSSEKLAEWAVKNRIPFNEVQAELNKDNSPLKKLIRTARWAAVNLSDPDLTAKEFRAALESAQWGYRKDHWAYQLIQEILPYADRNSRYIDLLRKSNYVIDATRNKIVETMRMTMKDTFDPDSPLTTVESEAFTKLLARTDMVSLMETMNVAEIYTMLSNPTNVETEIADRLQRLSTILRQHPDLMKRFDVQSQGLAHLMMVGVPPKGAGHQEYNVYNIVVTQEHLGGERKIDLGDDTNDVLQLMEELTTLRAIQWLNQNDQASMTHAMRVVERELRRGERNGFSDTLGHLGEFKQQAFEKNFDSNPIMVWKGYVLENYDGDIDAKWVRDTAEMEELLTAQGYVKRQTYKQHYVKGEPVALYTHKSRGVNTYSASIMSLAGQQKHGFGLYDMSFALETWDHKRPGRSASKVRNMVNFISAQEKISLARNVAGKPPSKDFAMIPVYNTKGEIVDWRFTMTHANKREYLGMTTRIEEVLPRMFGAIEEKVASQEVNTDVLGLLYREYSKYGQDPDHRFVTIGHHGKWQRHSTEMMRRMKIELEAAMKQAKKDGRMDEVEKLRKQLKEVRGVIESKEMWDLMPKATRVRAEKLFGGKFLPVRDEMYNMVFGFRKMAFSNNEWLGRTAWAFRIIEKVWQELIGWERFRIAVLEPSVVIGNMVSNFFVLWSKGIPASYIWRMANEGIASMRAYQKLVTQSQTLEHQINVAQQLGRPTAKLRQKLAMLRDEIEVNPAHELVEEGLFTSIVEEIAPDENSTRRKAVQKVVDAGGKVIAGKNARAAGRLTNELFMFPGSNLARLALMGTQYGDFIARYIQMNWDVNVQKKDRDVAIRDALSTFIFYNIPQNKYLQYMNDSGVFMFTKFFFRIQHVALRLFQDSPSRAVGSFVLQSQFRGSILGDSVGNYAGNLEKLFAKFDPMPMDNMLAGDTFKPMLLEWMTFPFDD